VPLVYDGISGEGGLAEKVAENAFAVLRMATTAIWPMARKIMCKERCARRRSSEQTGFACSARSEGHHHVVARFEATVGCACGNDNACALMSEDTRHWHRQFTVPYSQVGMAKPGRYDFDQHLISTRSVKFHWLDLERFSGVAADSCECPHILAIRVQA
jgi:hypothetical protein